MVAFDTGPTLADRFRAHAGDQTHLYAHLMRAMAEDWERGGPVRAICSGYQDAPTGAVLQLRLLAGLFRIVLTGRAPELVPFYPCLGGERSPEEAWPVVRSVMVSNVDELHHALTVPPQTNEVGRSVALLAGLFDLAAAAGVRRVRLLEIGASAGLNLLLAHFYYGGRDWSWGDPTSPVQLIDTIEGPVRPLPVTIVDAVGCDPDPVDATSEDGRLLLTSFVWPFQLERHTRLAAALEVAAVHPPRVERGNAAEWLARTLPHLPDDGALPVVWHSISQLYWPAGEDEAVIAAIAAHPAPVGRVAMEYLTPSDRTRRPDLRTGLWQPGEPVRTADLGLAGDHGLPVTLHRGPTAPS